MLKFGNENLLKLVLSSFTSIDTRQLLEINANSTICKILIRLINYEHIFKTISKFGTILDKENIEPINTMAILPNGTIIIAHNDGILRFWDMNYHLCVYVSKIILNIKSIFILPRVNIATLNKHEDYVQFWEIDPELKCYNFIKPNINEVYFSNILLQPNGNFVCSTYVENPDEFNDIQIFNCNNDYRLFKILTGHEGLVGASVNLDGNRFATSCTNILIWDSDYNCLESLKGDSEITCLSYDHTRRRLLSVSFHMRISVWDLTDYCLFKVIQINSIARCCLALPNRYIAFGLIDGKINIYDSYTFECINSIEAHQGSITSLILSKNEIVSSSINEILIWEF
jgi:WD40 repeat protein